MSYKHPTVSEILTNSSSDNPLIRDHFSKNYRNLASYEFIKRNKRKPTLDDAQEIYNLYEEEWKDIIPRHLKEHEESVKRWARTQEFFKLFN